MGRVDDRRCYSSTQDTVSMAREGRQKTSEKGSKEGANDVVTQPTSLHEHHNHRTVPVQTANQISLLRKNGGELLLASPAVSMEPSSDGNQLITTLLPALTTSNNKRNHIQLDQSAFPSGLGGHLLQFERVPMVEFVKPAV